MGVKESLATGGGIVLLGVTESTWGEGKSKKTFRDIVATTHLGWGNHCNGGGDPGPRAMRNMLVNNFSCAYSHRNCTIRSLKYFQ